MGTFRKDQVPLVHNFMVLALIGATCIPDGNFIRLFLLQISNEVYQPFVFLFYFFLFVVLSFSMFLRVNVIIAFKIIIISNLVLQAFTTLLFLGVPMPEMVYDVVIVLWAFTSGFCVFNAAVFASYNISGIIGLIFGYVLQYAFVFILLDFLSTLKWHYGNFEGYSALGKVFIVCRLILSIITLISFNSLASEKHYPDFERAMKHYRGRDGSQPCCKALVAHDILPRFLNMKDAMSTLRKTKDASNCLVLFMILSITSSLFFPDLASYRWILSQTGARSVERTRVIANFFGVILGFVFRIDLLGFPFLVSLSIVHFVIATLSTIRLYSYILGSWITIGRILVVVFFSEFSGALATVGIVSKYIRGNFELRCESSDRACCNDDTSRKCFCTEFVLHEGCSKILKAESYKIIIPHNNEYAYKLCKPTDCLYCKFSRDGACENGSECYILRNTKATVCPYCDLSLLLECEKIRCNCGKKCPADGVTPVCDFCSTSCTKNGNSYTKLCTNYGGTRLELVTNSSSSLSSHCECCNGAVSFNINGKNGAGCQCKGCLSCFDVSKFVTFCCCHYGLKVLILCELRGGQFSIGKRPFESKFDQISAIIFEGNNNSGLKVRKFSKSEPLKGKCLCCPLGGCMIKVSPSGLPYPFRYLDFYRYEKVSMLFMAIFVFVIVKLIVSIFFTASDLTNSIYLSMDLPLVKNYISVKMNNMPVNGMDNAIESCELGSNREESQIFIQDLNENINAFSGLAGPSELMNFRLWAREKFPRQTDNASVHRFRALLNDVFLYQIVKTGNGIYELLDKVYGPRWDIEWRMFKLGLLSKVESISVRSRAMSPFGTNLLNNVDLQLKIDKLRIDLWKNMSKEAESLISIVTDCEKLEDAVKNATDGNMLKTMLGLWKYRKNLIFSWADSGELFLDWSLFLENWDYFLKFEEKFLDYYIRHYDSYGVNLFDLPEYSILETEL